MVRLGDVSDILNGFAFESNKFSKDSKYIPIIRIRDVLRGWSNTFYSGEYDPKYLISKGDLLIGMDGEFNISEWKRGEALLNQRVCKIIADNTILHTKYLYYFLPKALKEIEDKTPFVTVKHLSAKSIESISLPLPPLDEQKRIAEVLDKASELIKKRKEQIRLMDELAKSLFIEMFGDPVENPMGWELGKLSEHTNILTGYPFDSSKYVEDKSQIKICGGLIIMPDKIDWDSANYWSSSEADNLDKYFLQTDDIVLAMDRPWISSGIKVGMIKQDNLPAILIQRTARIRGIGMQQYYLFELFKSPLFTNHCKPTETTVPHIAMGDIKKFVIPLPPLPLQNEFADRIAVIEQQKTLLQNGLAKMETAYKALMQEYFDAERPLLEQNT